MSVATKTPKFVDNSSKKSKKSSQKNLIGHIDEEFNNDRYQISPQKNQNEVKNKIDFINSLFEELNLTERSKKDNLTSSKFKSIHNSNKKKKNSSSKPPSNIEAIHDYENEMDFQKNKTNKINEEKHKQEHVPKYSQSNIENKKSKKRIIDSINEGEYEIPSSYIPRKYENPMNDDNEFQLENNETKSKFKKREAMISTISDMDDFDYSKPFKKCSPFHDENYESSTKSRSFSKKNSQISRSKQQNLQINEENNSKKPFSVNSSTNFKFFNDNEESLFQSERDPYQSKKYPIKDFSPLQINSNIENIPHSMLKNKKDHFLTSSIGDYKLYLQQQELEEKSESLQNGREESSSKPRPTIKSRTYYPDNEDDLSQISQTSNQSNTNMIKNRQKISKPPRPKKREYNPHDEEEDDEQYNKDKNEYESEKFPENTDYFTRKEAIIANNITSLSPLRSNNKTKDFAQMNKKLEDSTKKLHKNYEKILMKFDQHVKPLLNSISASAELKTLRGSGKKHSLERLYKSPNKRLFSSRSPNKIGRELNDNALASKILISPLKNEKNMELMCQAFMSTAHNIENFYKGKNIFQ